MPSLQLNLETLFKSQKFSKALIYSLGIQLVNMFEQVHESGFVYNDLKLNNLMLGHDF